MKVGMWGEHLGFSTDLCPVGMRLSHPQFLKSLTLLLLCLFFFFLPFFFPFLFFFPFADVILCQLTKEQNAAIFPHLNSGSVFAAPLELELIECVGFLIGSLWGGTEDEKLQLCLPLPFLC